MAAMASAVGTCMQAATQLTQFGLKTLLPAAKTFFAAKETKEAYGVVKIDTHKIVGFKTLEDPLKDVLSLVTEENKVKGILIHGLLGTGKTTIMQNLNNHVLVANRYDIVIWLKVSSDDLDRFEEKKNFSIEKLQKEVMRRLYLDFDHTIPVDQYREVIKNKLRNTKYLLLLDNVKADLDLDEIGFPKNWEKCGSKVVLTSRSKVVCPSIVERVVKVKLLEMEEAMTVFTNILESSESSIKKKYILQAVKHCGSLITAINIAAHSFKFVTDEQTLNDKINALKTWPRDGDTMITEICRTIGICCEDLTREQKGCFYYGALYPEEGNICKDHLLDCWMAENDFVETRAHWRILLRQLNDRNLFEGYEGKTYVTMHKLIRLLALHNMQTDGSHSRICLVPTKEVSSNQQEKNSWEGKHWISLADKYNLEAFLVSPGCSKLSTVFLQRNLDFTKFPDSFFKEMGSLRVLDLMGTNMESLPDSFGKSTELAVLYLNECTKLLNLSSVLETLEFLRVLDISGSGFNEVPKQIQRLKSLKRFLVSSSAICGTDKISETISQLPELQEMLIDTKSEKETFNWKNINDVIESVKTLRSFRLRLRFLNDEVVDVWEVEDGVRKFFGHKILNDAELGMLFQRYVEYYSGRKPSSTVVKLLSVSDALVIAKRDDLENLQTLVSSKSAAILVESCKKLTYILGPVGVLSSLEQLHLNDMEKLESVTLGKFSLANFGKLKTLKLCRCLLLTNIITADAVVDNGMSTGSGTEPLVFPKLEKLVLVDIPKLESIWKDKLLEYPALIKVEISHCPALKYFPISHKNTELKSVITEKTWWEALEWKDPAAKKHFGKYLTFVV